MAGAPNPKDESRIGSADDSSNGTVDPTKNVLDLVRAESKFQDALREAAAVHSKEMRDEITKFQNAMREAESRLQHTINAHQITNNQAETRRLDDLAAQRQQYEIRAADALALQVKTTSDLISTQLDKVTNSLSQQIRDGTDNFASQMKNLGETLGARIYDLEKSQWGIAGRSSVADPATAATLAAIAATLKDLSTKESTQSGARGGQASVVSYIALAIGAGAAFLAIASKLFT